VACQRGSPPASTPDAATGKQARPCKRCANVFTARILPRFNQGAEGSQRVLGRMNPLGPDRFSPGQLDAHGLACSSQHPPNPDL